MLQKLKDIFAEKIISIINNSDRKRVENYWSNFVAQPNVNIDKTFFTLNTSLFKGQNNLFGNITIAENFSLRDFCTIIVYPNANLHIGKRVFFNNFCSINCLEDIQIGDDVLFGEGVKLYDHNHLIDKNDRINVSKENFSTSPIVIGKNCWLGSNVIVLKGVTIGDNCVIGANCIIYKSIPNNSIVKNDQNLIFETL